MSLLKKTNFSAGEIQIFDDAIIYKRGGIWQFRMWLAKEGKYARFSLRTPNQATATDKAKQRYHELMAMQGQGRTYFSKTAKQGVEKYLAQRKKDVGAGIIVEGRYGTIKTHLEHWLDFIGKDRKLKELGPRAPGRSMSAASSEAGRDAIALPRVYREIMRGTLPPGESSEAASFIETNFSVEFSVAQTSKMLLTPLQISRYYRSLGNNKDLLMKRVQSICRSWKAVLLRQHSCSSVCVSLVVTHLSDFDVIVEC